MGTLDALFILLVIYFVFYLLVKRVKRAANTGQDHTPGAVRNRQADTRKHSPTSPKPDAMNRPAISRTGQPGMSYAPIQPMVQVNQTLYDYKGSLSATSTEGSASGEGNASGEGSGTTEGGEVFTTDVLQEAEKPEIWEKRKVLPQDWAGDELVQAVVMKEIFDKPRKWRY